jgi:serpin B
MRNRMLGMIALLLCLPVVVAVTAGAAEKKPGKAESTPLVQGNNQFALDLYARLKEQDGNLFFSPYSISTALAMTYGGARNQTAEAMAKTLHFTLDSAELHPAFAALRREINGDPKNEKRGYRLSTANALWAQKDYPFLPQYLQLTRDNYGSGVHEVDFAGATEAARQKINGWVEKETNDKIKDLLKPDVLTAETRLVLTNAIYFKGNWNVQFKKDRTRDEIFHLASDKTVKAPMMHQTDSFGYGENEVYQALEMPYAGKELSMVVLLPRKLNGMPALEKALAGENFAAKLSRTPRQEVIVTLPKFKTTAEFSLKKTLGEMGMGVAFTSGADFTGMNGGKEQLTISAVIHKAFVDVNEEGTEAAAATAVGIEPASIEINPKPTPVFRADHPFVFLIRDTRNNSILFMGRLMDPTR